MCASNRLARERHNLSSNSDTSAYDDRGFAFLRVGDYARSIADAAAALRLAPDNPYSLAGRGLAKTRLGDTAGGQADIQAGLRLKPGIKAEFEGRGFRLQ